MTTLSRRISAAGFLVGASALFLSTVADAAVPIAPLANGSGVVKVAQGCGLGRWRGPGGWCHGPAYYPGYYHPGWGYSGYYGRRCWRGAYGYWHCV